MSVKEYLKKSFPVSIPIKAASAGRPHPAIAHGLEEICEVEAPKKAKKRKKRTS